MSMKLESEFLDSESRVCMMLKPLHQVFCNYESLNRTPINSSENISECGFPSERHNKLCSFISDIADYFLAGEDKPQNNQPNGQSGSQP